jgi:multiple sugar transport system substrate-binding protein
MGQYLPGLAQLWRTAERQAVRLPEGLGHRRDRRQPRHAQKAGITKQQLDTATWNPTDGGSFEKLAAHLTVDKNGKRGDEPGFDPANVAVYGHGAGRGRLHLRPDDVGRASRAASGSSC